MNTGDREWQTLQRQLWWVEMIDFEHAPKNLKTATVILNSKFPNRFPKFGSPSKKSDQMQTISICKAFLHRHPHRRILSSFQVEIEAFNLSDKNLILQ